MNGMGKVWFSFMLVLLCGCTALKDMNDGADVRIRTNVVEHVVRDSIFVHDSIFVREKFDTVFFTKYRTLYKENLIRDTIYLCDTLYKERVITEYASHNGNKSFQWLLLLLPLLYPGVLKWLLKMFLKCIRFFLLKV